MRNLTIKRAKSFVASLVKMKIYIEDHTAGELTINNVPCRKLRDLKNGEEKTFVIGEEAAKVFVIGDKLSRNYSNEFYSLPQGQEDIVLSGRNKYNLANGNAFQFDNNNSEEVLANRKKGKRTGLIVLIIAAIVGFGIGFLSTSGILSAGNDKAKSFCASGMEITLTKSFRETEVPGFTVAYDSKDVAVLALKESFASLEGLNVDTLSQYAQVVLQNNGKNPSSLKNDGDRMYFAYDANSAENGKTYHYVTYLYEADDAYWIIQFATLKENADKYAEDITGWARSVTFTK